MTALTGSKTTQYYISAHQQAANQAEQLTSLSRQFRREGNDTGALAAHMSAVAAADRLHPIAMALAETTRALNPTEQKRILHQAETRAAHANQQNEENQPHMDRVEDDCTDVEEGDWYYDCFQIRSLAAQARNDLAPSKLGLGHPPQYIIDDPENYRRALPALEKVLEESPLPENTPFPQTRAQLLQQTRQDLQDLRTTHAEIQRWRSEHTRQDRNSPGACFLCGSLTLAANAQNHARQCAKAIVAQNTPTPRHRESIRNQPLLVHVRSLEGRHWMVLLLRSTTSLRQLDQFLRTHWLECCGHMSHFQVGKQKYSACIPGPGDAWAFDDHLSCPEEKDMLRTVTETIKPGTRFHHEFDYGDTTCLNLRRMHPIDADYEELRDLVSRTEEGAVVTEHITTLARNDLPETCCACTHTAHWRYHQNPHVCITPEEGGPIVAPPYFCDCCAPEEAQLVILRNSPRVGVGCYDNTHDEPEDDIEYPIQTCTPTGDPEEMQATLQLQRANRIIQWTTPHFNAAGDTVQHLPILTRERENDLQGSLTAIEDTILEWQRQSRHLLPASWSRLTNPREDGQQAIIDMVMEQHIIDDEMDELTQDPTQTLGTPDQLLAGIHQAYATTQDSLDELVQPYMASREPKQPHAPVEHADTDRRIIRIIMIADDLYQASSTVLTGVATHALAQYRDATTAEPPPPDTTANAAKTMAHAGAIARAAAQLIDFRIWPVLEQ